MIQDLPRLTWLNGKTKKSALPRKNTPGRKQEHEEAALFQGGIQGPQIDEEVNENE